MNWHISHLNKWRNDQYKLKYTTLNNGYLGSRNDEERSKMRNVMWNAILRESSNFWTQMACADSNTAQTHIWASLHFYSTRRLLVNGSRGTASACCRLSETPQCVPGDASVKRDENQPVLYCDTTLPCGTIMSWCFHTILIPPLRSSAPSWN